MKRDKFAIAAVFDTETCNLGTTAKTAHAIPILYIDNDIRNVCLTNYVPDRDDNVNFLRFEEEYLDRIKEYIQWGKIVRKTPIVCAYNLMFDLQSLMESLSDKYDVEVNAQSSTNVYTLDLLSKSTGKRLLRFWDTFHLDMRGLSKMGEVAGLPKANGDWNYDLIRTPNTPLTESELFYAKRDTQVIPAFLSFLLRTNDWMKESDLGCKVLTKTSLVRQMAKNEIGPTKILKADGKRITVEKMFLKLCEQEMPKTYEQYALRKACFRGGYTFTAAAFASTIQHNVASVDVTSMHHTFINGRMLPDRFKVLPNDAIDFMVRKILSTPRSEVMSRYWKPFDCAIHAKLSIKNIRIRTGSAFEEYGIALEPMSKFKAHQVIETDESKELAENELISSGWTDSYSNAKFAFGKLYSADEIIIHVNEIELWTMSRVYEWDSIDVLFGEGTNSFCRPPDYVTLQSNILYRLKDDNKFISEHYREGEPYPYNIPDTVPETYRNGLLDGTLRWEDFNAYYISDTKGKFNGIYGTMAQDVFKPSYKCESGVISVDRRTVVTVSNWNESQPESCRVLYTYGMRIVAGSRLHMVLAIERVHETLGTSARILGGDTDSMKIALADTVTNDDLEESLSVFADISKAAINETMARVRKLYPKQASTLRGVGGFDIENGGMRYETHIELWNKCRVSVDSSSRAHVTCAGLPRPADKYHIERFMTDLIASGNRTEDVISKCVGYNVFVSHDICHTLEGHRPKPQDMVDSDITDYLGTTEHVRCHEVTCLYPTGRWLGETLKRDNMNTVAYMREVYGRYADVRTYRLEVSGEEVFVSEEGKSGFDTIMGGVSEWLSSCQR